MAPTALHSPELRNYEALDDPARYPALAFEEAAAALDLEPRFLDRLRHPVEESTSYLQLLRDSGDAACVPFLQVQHSAAWGAAIGSLSLLPDLAMRTCEVIAMERTWQAALLELPFGGASYGLVCDPDQLSERELMRLLGLAAHQLHRSGARPAVLFPGRGCCGEFMAKLFAESRTNRYVVVAGKPACLGGLNTDQFVAEGIVGIVLQTLASSDRAAKDAKLAVQGFGSLGKAVSERLASEGLAIVGLSDSSGAVYRADGLILSDILEQVRHQDVLFGYREAEPISRAELLKTNADVLVLTSGSGEIHANNYSTISAPTIIEAEWGGVTPGAKQKLATTRIGVVPWMVANAGALLGAYFESREEQVVCDSSVLLAKTRAAVQQLCSKISVAAGGKQTTLDHAARQLAVEHVAEYLRLCGGEGY